MTSDLRIPSESFFLINLQKQLTQEQTHLYKTNKTAALLC